MTWNPAVRGAWARNIEPNLPAPINPTRTGRPASARARSFACRFIALLRRRPALTRITQQAIVIEHLDRREITIGDPARPLEAADGVVAAIEREIDDPTRPRRQIRSRGMHEIAVKQQHRTRRALRRDDATLGDQPRDRLVV